MTRLLAKVRRGAGATKRWLVPGADLAAWRRACRLAERTPRYTPGRLQLGPYTVQYPDLLSLCPQWHDIFVKGSLKFNSRTPRPRILDCGANVGLASLFFKRLYPSARITAFEADPAIAAMLAANLRDNGAADVEAVAAAIWTTEVELEFGAEGADSGAIREIAGELRGAVVRVPARRLREVIAHEPIDLVKLDIEGAEAAVLDDCKDVLSNVSAMILDLHDFDAAHRRIPDLLRQLSACGFTYAASDLTPLPWRPPVAADRSPFPGHALSWVMTVRAWRSDLG